jgi:hypothetical protein
MREGPHRSNQKQLPGGTPLDAQNAVPNIVALTVPREPLNYRDPTATPEWQLARCSVNAVIGSSWPFCDRGGSRPAQCPSSTTNRLW